MKNEPESGNDDAYNAHAGRHGAQRPAERVLGETGPVDGDRLCESKKGKFEGEDPAAEAIGHDHLQHRSGEDPEGAGADGPEKSAASKPGQSRRGANHENASGDEPETDGDRPQQAPWFIAKKPAQKQRPESGSHTGKGIKNAEGQRPVFA